MRAFALLATTICLRCACLVWVPAGGFAQSTAPSTWTAQSTAETTAPTVAAQSARPQPPAAAKSAGKSPVATAAGGETGALIQELCLDTSATWDQAMPKLKAREQPPEVIREEKFGKASVHHLKLSDTAEVALTVSHEDNAVMSCTLHVTVPDVKAAFTDLQRRYQLKGPLADYTIGKPAKNVPFVSRVAKKPGRKMLGLFEFQQRDGQAGGSVQAIILRDENAAGPPPEKTVAAKSPAKKAAAKAALAPAAPDQTANVKSARN